MVKILITGATGYIGFEVALALRRAGHVVYALSRSSTSPYAKTLAENEVRVVVGDINDHASFLDIAKQASVLIHAAADYSAFDKVDGLAADAFFEAAKQGPRKLLIYTSGILVYPESPSFSDEDTSLDESIGFLAGRRGVEQRFLRATEADGVVIRPAYVYGKRNVKVFYQYFEQASKGEQVFVTNKPGVGWSQIHVDDLAQAYVRVVEAPRANVSGQIFNVSDDSRSSNEEVAREFSRLAGYSGTIEFKPELGWPIANRSVYASSRKLTRVTGWTPKHISILSEADIYYDHWKSFAPQN